MQNNQTQNNQTQNNQTQNNQTQNTLAHERSTQSIRKLSNKDLDFILGCEIKRESQQTMVVIHHMREVDRRRLWAELGYASLSKYCADRFQMSDSDFYRKLSIMRTLNDVPEIEAKIISGDLNPTTVAMAHTYFRKKTKLKGRKVTKDEKVLVFEQITGQSQREVERTFATLSPEIPPPDQKKFISSDRIMIQFTTTVDVDAKFHRLKELLFAALPSDPNRNDVLNKIFDIALEKLDPIKQIERADKRKAGKLERAQAHETKNKSKEVALAAEDPKTPALRKRCVTHRPYRSVDKMRHLYRRSEGICEFVCEKTGRRCTARAALQGDHIQGYALGGSEEVGNYRLYCPAHNQFAAVQTYGSKHMQKFVPSLR